MIAELNNWHTLSWLWLLTTTAAQEKADSKINQILDFLNNHSMIGWGIAGFTVMAMATAAIAQWTGNLETIIKFAQEYLFRKKREFTEAQRQQARADLIEILLKQVVKRLEDSLHHKIRIDLRREEQLQRVGQGNLAPVQEEETEQASDNFIRRAFRLPEDSTPPKAICGNKSTQELFEQKDIQGRLLILGEPGSGKTNELLVLARDSLYQAQQSPEKPIPIIFELSEWRPGSSEQGFADWLAQQMLDKYNIPLVISQHWIRQKQLLPLLDGLDELRRVDEDDEVTSEEIDKRRIAKQIQCVRKITAFLDTYSLPLVVCCRRKEYEALEAQGEYLKRLNGAIYIQPLEDEQIQEYLQKLNRDLLWKSLQSKPELLKLAYSPLFLLILVVAYQGQNIRSTKELLDAYIHKQLHDLNNQGAYPPGKAPTSEGTHHYLCCLATKLEVEETTEFLIEQLQPSWLDTSKAHKNYRWIVGLIIGLIYGLIDGLLTWLSIGLNTGLIVGLIDGLSGWLNFGLILGLIVERSEGLIVGLIVGLSEGLIDGIIIGLSEGLIDGILPGLVSGLFSGVIAGLISRRSRGLSEIQNSEKLSFSWTSSYKRGLIGGLILGLSGVLSGVLSGGLIGGLILGLIGVLSGGLIGGIETREIDVPYKMKPNQGIRDSTRNGLILGSILGLIVGLIEGSIFGLIFGLGGGLFVGLIGGLIGGLDATIKHLSLRIALYQSGVSPWNYARFLEHAENHRFIQRTGGRYRFVHDLIRKRFAATLNQP